MLELMGLQDEEEGEREREREEKELVVRRYFTSRVG